MSGKRRIGEKQYRVTVVSCTNYERIVNAKDEDEAREKAEADSDHFPLSPRWRRTPIQKVLYLSDITEVPTP